MRLKDENKVLALREKAIELIVKEGFDGLSMQKLAKAANVSPATIYLYFKNREDLILELHRTVNDQMMAATLKNFDPALSFAEGLRIQWKNRAEFFMNNLVEMQFLEQFRHSPFNDREWQPAQKVFREVMGQFMANAIRNNELVPLPFEVYWSVAFSPLYQLVKFHTQGRSHVSKTFTLTDDLLDQTLALVLKALKP